MRILLVDDDPEIRLLAGHLLRSAGHTVVEAGDAASARANAERERPDLLLVDVLLGEDDGIEVGIALRAQCNAGTRLAFFTAAGRPEQLLRMQAAEPAGILHKPFDPGLLAAAVAALCDPTP